MAIVRNKQAPLADVWAGGQEMSKPVSFVCNVQKN